MVQAELTPFPKVVEQLKGLCDLRRTGTAFLVSDENRMAQIHLDGGSIVSIIHRNKRGIEALAVLALMKNAKLRFDDSYVTTAEKHDISTQDVLDYLDGKKSIRADSANSLGSLSGGMITAEAKAGIQSILTRYVGPMAEIICADHFERATGPNELVESLAREIADREQAAQFVKAVSSYLAGAVPQSAKSISALSSAPMEISAETRSIVIRMMTKYVGPMAEIVCAEHFERATDLRSLVQLLVAEVPDQQQAAKFAVEISKSLGLKST